MKIAFVASALPAEGHTVRAATVLVREAMLSLQRQGHDVVLLPLFAAAAAPESRALTRAIEWSQAHGIAAAQPMVVPTRRTGGSALRSALSRRPEDFFESVSIAPELARRLDGFDAAFSLWSDEAPGALSAAPVPAFVYAGNPPHKALLARLLHPEIFGHRGGKAPSSPRMYGRRRALENLRQASTRLMLRARWIGNVTALDAEYWTREGHPAASYMQNMWPVAEGEPPRPAQSGNKIVGSLGGLYATGNSFGLHFLGSEVAPALQRTLGNVEVHVFGAGEPYPAVDEALRHPLIVRRGFAEDIDGEIASSRVFLLANNSCPDFVGGHTRILHAWSLNAPLVAHANIARAMPEVVHGRNALLGRDADEIAQHVASVFDDHQLAERLAVAGQHTLRRHFTPDAVMSRVTTLMNATAP
jgi:glycosyl transferase family 1